MCCRLASVLQKPTLVSWISLQQRSYSRLHQQSGGIAPHWHLYMGVSENSVPLNPMALLIIIPIKWLVHWEYTLFSDKPTSSTESTYQVPVLVTSSSTPWRCRIAASATCASRLRRRSAGLHPPESLNVKEQNIDVPNTNCTWIKLGHCFCECNTHNNIDPGKPAAEVSQT